MKFYIEAGANDGIFQSRSLHLYNNPEYFGILIEPLPDVYNRCCANRKNRTKLYNCALVDFDHKEKHIPINLHNQHSAMACINMASSEKYLGPINVDARTLESILAENNIVEIEYFYLDVEGYEPNVLRGIDFSKRIFRYLEIECHYSLTGITEYEETLIHKNILEPHGYKLSSVDRTEGLPKLIFTI